MHDQKKIASIFAATLILAGCNTAGMKGGGNPSNSGPEQQVHLIWKNATDQWRVKLNNGSEQKPADAHTMLNQGIGPTMFVVDIQGPTTVSFKDLGGLDVWEGAGKKSRPQSGINSTQILGPIVTKNGKQLIFFDLNQGNAVTLNYRLNFDSGPSVDPIVDNGGSNGS